MAADNKYFDVQTFLSVAAAFAFVMVLYGLFHTSLEEAGQKIANKVKGD